MKVRRIVEWIPATEQQIESNEAFHRMFDAILAEKVGDLKRISPPGYLSEDEIMFGVGKTEAEYDELRERWDEAHGGDAT